MLDQALPMHRAMCELVRLKKTKKLVQRTQITTTRQKITLKTNLAQAPPPTEFELSAI